LLMYIALVTITQGQIYELAPLIVILILIVAAAGLTRGADIFSLFGIGTLMGLAGGMGSGGAGRGLKGASVQRRIAKSFKKLGSPVSGQLGKLAKSAAKKKFAQFKAGRKTALQQKLTVMRALHGRATGVPSQQAVRINPGYIRFSTSAIGAAAAVGSGLYMSQRQGQQPQMAQQISQRAQGGGTATTLTMRNKLAGESVPRQMAQKIPIPIVRPAAVASGWALGYVGVPGYRDNLSVRMANAAYKADVQSVKAFERQIREQYGAEGLAEFRSMINADVVAAAKPGTTVKTAAEAYKGGAIAGTVGLLGSIIYHGGTQDRRDQMIEERQNLYNWQKTNWQEAKDRIDNGVPRPGDFAIAESKPKPFDAGKKLFDFSSHSGDTISEVNKKITESGGAMTVEQIREHVRDSFQASEASKAAAKVKADDATKAEEDAFNRHLAGRMGLGEDQASRLSLSDREKEIFRDLYAGTYETEKRLKASSEALSDTKSEYGALRDSRNTALHDAEKERDAAIAAADANTSRAEFNAMKSESEAKYNRATQTVTSIYSVPPAIPAGGDINDQMREALDQIKDARKSIADSISTSNATVSELEEVGAAHKKFASTMEGISSDAKSEFGMRTVAGEESNPTIATQINYRQAVLLQKQDELRTAIDEITAAGNVPPPPTSPLIKELGATKAELQKLEDERKRNDDEAEVALAESRVMQTKAYKSESEERKARKDVGKEIENLRPDQDRLKDMDHELYQKQLDLEAKLKPPPEPAEGLGLGPPDMGPGKKLKKEQGYGYGY